MKIADAMLSTIGELDLRDEYALLPHTAVLSDVRLLTGNPRISNGLIHWRVCQTGR